MTSTAWRSDPREARAFAAFLLVGAASTLLSYLLYLGLLTVAVPWVAYVLSFIAGVVFSTLLNLRHAFRAAINLPNAAIYLLCYALTCAIGVGVLRVLVEAGGIPAAIAPLGVLAVTVPTNFVLCRALIGRFGRS